jgi:ArsR family transcriptional regulator
MNHDEMIKFKNRSEILKAMAHPTRLFIMSRIKDSRYSVKALQEMIGCDISTISKHLSVLKKAGIVKGEKSGNIIYHSLKVPCIMDFMQCVEIIIKENAVEKLGNL